MAKPSKADRLLAKQQGDIKHDQFLRAAVLAAGESLADLGTILIQGIRDDNRAKLGGVAVGFERAASYCRGQLFSQRAADVDPKHKNQPATTMDNTPVKSE